MNEADTPHPSDAELIARAQSAEIEAFGELYAQYRDPIFRYVRTRVDETSDAEDLCEAVFLRTFEVLGRYQECGHPFSAYLYQVARNLLADNYRTQEVRRNREQVSELAAPDADPEAAYAQRERALHAVDSLRKLQEDYQDVIRLRVVLELPTSTAAMWMDRSPGAVRALLHRAPVALREELDG